jgi:hypothetical protein
MDLINTLSNTNEYLCIADITSLQKYNRRLKILSANNDSPQYGRHTSAIL